jgi:hypothetical protein
MAIPKKQNTKPTNSSLLVNFQSQIPIILLINHSISFVWACKSIGILLILREMKGMEKFLRDNYYSDQAVYVRWVENYEKVVCRTCRKLILGDKLCDGCTGLISTSFYSCTQCNFFLHSKCVQLPKNKWHPLHRHSLTLFSQQSIYVLGFFSCKACQCLSNGFSYRCGTCSFNFDLQCCSISETLNHERHQHSLFLAVNSNRRCHVCNFTFDEKPCLFVCTYCDFALGFECATLLLVARHKVDNHLLKLTYNVEARCEECYCLICEKERDSK